MKNAGKFLFILLVIVLVVCGQPPVPEPFKDSIYWRGI